MTKAKVGKKARVASSAAARASRNAQIPPVVVTVTFRHVEPSVAIIRDTLTSAGHHAFSIVVFPDANHGLFVTSADGRETLAAGYLDAIDDWLRKTLRS